MGDLCSFRHTEDGIVFNRGTTTLRLEEGDVFLGECDDLRVDVLITDQTRLMWSRITKRAMPTVTNDDMRDMCYELDLPGETPEQRNRRRREIDRVVTDDVALRFRAAWYMIALWYKKNINVWDVEEMCTLPGVRRRLDEHITRWYRMY
jgi:hypothetical protein